MKVLFLVPYPSKGASNRVRIEQFLPYLEDEGIIYKIRPFINERFFDILYTDRHYIEKIFWFIICTVNRVCDLIRACHYDAIFIHREAYPFGGPVLESILHWMKKPFIFDFDDAIFLPNTSEHNIYIERFKDPRKIKKIIMMSRKAIAGNSYLRDYALQFNKNVIVLPSTIDTGKYHPAVHRPDKNEVVIGWVGSNTTRAFLYDLEEVFVELSRRYRHVVFEVVGARFHSATLKNIINKEWSLQDEPSDLCNFDVGIMPMPDNEWTRGKCGFKSILYMGCGLPVVTSPVGVNNELISDGVNGFMAKDAAEWIEKLSLLIEDSDLRRKMGSNGRRLVEEKYSVKANAKLFLNILKSVI